MLSFENFLNLTDYKGKNEKTTISWDSYLVSQELFFQRLCSDENADWKKCGDSLKNWESNILQKFELKIRQSESEKRVAEKKDLSNEANREKYENSIKVYKKFQRKLDIFKVQFNHAVKLFTAAEYVEKNKNLFPEVLEQNDGEDIITRFFKFINESAQFKERKINIKENEFILLCFIFYSKSLPSEVREIPFATAPNDEDDEGKIHLLELRRVCGYGKTLENPCRFPQADIYAKEIDDDFRESIQNALRVNFPEWDKELPELRERISYLESIQNRTLKEDIELNGDNNLKKDLGFRESLGDITKYGIIWDIKPFLSKLEKKALVNYEEEIKKAKQENKSIEHIKKPEIQQYPHILDGDSVGWAARKGIYYALRRKYPDKLVVHSAKLETINETDKDRKTQKTPTGRINQVNDIPKKIEAAISTEVIDSFFIHNNDFIKDEIKLLNLIKRKNFRIITFDSNENIVGEFLGTSIESATNNG